MIDTAAYLARIGYQGRLTPTAATLSALHQAHLLAVPFENIAILDRQPIVLEESALFDKIVRQRRGGICYELNGLFATLLRALGFSLDLLAARDVHADGTLGPPFDHLALHVRTAGSWLVDIGWGDQFIRPLRLDRRDAQSDGRRAYRVSVDEEHGHPEYVVARRWAEGWEALYCFTLHPYPLAAFGPTCHYHQHASAAPFRTSLLCTRLTPTGRVTLTDDRLITTSGDARHEHPVGEGAAHAAALWEHFGLARAA